MTTTITHHTAMKQAMAFLTALIVSFAAYAQEAAYKISGLVIDFDNGEPVIGATVGFKG